MTPTRRVAAVVVPLTIAAVAIVPVALWWSRLPSRIAIHWDGGGEPNGHLSRASGVLMFVLPAALAAVVLAVLLRGRRPVVPGPALAAFFGGLLAAIAAFTVWANVDGERWQDGDIPATAPVLPLVAGVLAAGAVVRWDGVRRETDPSVGSIVPTTPPRWQGGCHAGWAILAGAALGILTTAATVIGGATFVAVVFGAIVGAALLPTIALRVAVHDEGIVVRSVVGWPRASFATDFVERAEVVQVDAMQWGWGFRGSRRHLGRGAWVLRSGEGVRLHLRDGSTFTVTVDDAAGAVAALRGMAQAQVVGRRT
jgi:hypothetical protein